MEVAKNKKGRDKRKKKEKRQRRNWGLPIISVLTLLYDTEKEHTSFYTCLHSYFPLFFLSTVRSRKGSLPCNMSTYLQCEQTRSLFQLHYHNFLFYPSYRLAVFCIVLEVSFLSST